MATFGNMDEYPKYDVEQKQQTHKDINSMILFIRSSRQEKTQLCCLRMLIDMV